jgi:diguanylate cyclase (GGDEF)-like protein
MNRLLECMERRSKGFILSLGLLAIGFFGIIDYLTGTEVRFFIFYWPAIAMVVWYIGGRWGYLYVALSGLAWLLANWTEVNTVETISTTLWNFSVNISSFAFLCYFVGRLKIIVVMEREVARTDFVTGIPNARAFSEMVRSELARCKRTGAPTSLAYLDVDHFKDVNDRFGHDAGDRLLREVSESLVRELRTSDLVARLGGDEFAVLLTGAGEREACAVIERCRAALRAMAKSQGWPVTFSFGVASCAGGGLTVEELMNEADALMYHAKEEGRDRAKYGLCAPPAGAPPSGKPTS